jgi:TonB family protein
MKFRLFVLVGLLVFAGCSFLLGSPKSTVQKFMSAAEKGDVDTMNSLFSSRAINREGLDKIKDNNKTLAELGQRASSRSRYSMNNVKEEINGDNARVSFHYQNADKTDSVRLVFALTRENGAWKIDNAGGAELEAISDLASAELKDAAPKKELVGTVPMINPSASPEAAPAAPGAPISGGVLNAKATNLVQPPYPPIAKAVKASGTVVVQVTVDEEGNVTAAKAISGHPLLQGVAVAAARASKFNPTKLSGKPVKVNGIINYNFELPAN